MQPCFSGEQGWSGAHLPSLWAPLREASADVAQAVADVNVDAPLRGTRDVADPEVFRLDELGRNDRGSARHS